MLFIEIFKEISYGYASIWKILTWNDFIHSFTHRIIRKAEYIISFSILLLQYQYLNHHLQFLPLLLKKRCRFWPCEFHVYVSWSYSNIKGWCRMTPPQWLFPPCGLRFLNTWNESFLLIMITGVDIFCSYPW